MSFTSRRLKEDPKPSSWRKYAALAVPLLESLYQMHKHAEHAKEEDTVKKKRERTLKLTVTVLLSALAVLLLFMGALKVIVRVKELALGMASVAGAELPHDENGLTNVLLLGEGDNDHEGIDLTDTVMIASLDPGSTKSAVLLSIPRDTYVLSTEKMGAGRINSLYRDYKGFLMRDMKGPEASAEALKQLTKEVGTLIGLELHGAIKVNFSGFEQGVDAIGGIDIVVPEDLIDTQYPGANYSYVTFSIAKGPQHVDGATALKYARSRHSTSDFSRSARQQQVIAAIAKKMKDDGLIKNVSRITELLSIVAKNVESTFSTRELLGFATMAKAIDTSHIVNMQLSDQNGLYGSYSEQGGFLYAPPRDQFDGAAVLLPVSIPEFPVTWKQVQTLSSLLFLKRELFIQQPRVMVLNAGGFTGAAGRLGAEIYRYGFNIEDTRNYAKGKNPSFDTSFIVVNPNLGKTEETKEAQARAQASAEFFASMLKMKIVTDAHPDAFTEGADIAIVLGKDFKYTPVQDLLPR